MKHSSSIKRLRPSEKSLEVQARQVFTSNLLEIPIPVAFTVGRPKFPDVIGKEEKENHWWLRPKVPDEVDGLKAVQGLHSQDWRK